MKTNSDKKNVVNELLDCMEAELNALSLWSKTSLPEDYINQASDVPFGCNVLDFHEWLQHIFYVRMKALITADQDLPSNMAITPMAQYVYRDELERHGKLIEILQKLDHAICNGSE